MVALEDIVTDSEDGGENHRSIRILKHRLVKMLGKMFRMMMGKRLE